MLKKIIVLPLLVIFTVLILLVIFLSVFEYRPSTIESVSVENCGKSKLLTHTEYSALSWNIGYGSLGKNDDFFMSGGKSVSLSKKSLQNNLDGIYKRLGEFNADINLIQEVDFKSSRTWKINIVEKISDVLAQTFVFASNYKCLFVPYPIPPIGNINSGLATFSDFETAEAFRYSLPVPFKWPVRLANLKRCLLVSRIPVYDGENISKKELVIVNLHLEAFDNGTAKREQTKVLVDFMNSEFAKGNYVIAGGDFNQSFPNSKVYPTTEQDDWVPGKLESSDLDSGWAFYFDDSLPTCRSTCAPYVGERAEKKDWQYYVIDGFIASPNVQVNCVKVLDEDFEFSDHNPILFKFVLK